MPANRYMLLTWPRDPEAPTKVHSGYEKNMIELKGVPATIMNELEQRLATGPQLEPIGSGHDAAVRTLQLMCETLRLLSPEDVISKYKEFSENDSRAIARRMWNTFKDQTIEVMTS
jgi:hypothetical protein